MSINWVLLEMRKPPTAADITKAVKKAKKLPDLGDHGHVQAFFPLEAKTLPAIPAGSWKKSKLQTVKFKRVFASNAQLSRDSLIWHLQNPGKSRFDGQWNTHPQVLALDNGDFVIIDGHHRMSAEKMLGLKREQCWVLDEKDL